MLQTRGKSDEIPVFPLPTVWCIVAWQKQYIIRQKYLTLLASDTVLSSNNQKSSCICPFLPLECAGSSSSLANFSDGAVQRTSHIIPVVENTQAAFHQLQAPAVAEIHSAICPRSTVAWITWWGDRQITGMRPSVLACLSACLVHPKDPWWRQSCLCPAWWSI